ncbi:MAG: 3-hydroxyacyl-CoA dehydrogenase NAD-binding domain-containing protein [Desulfococcaceae bacterium]
MEYKSLNISVEEDIAVFTVSPPPLNQVSESFVEEMSEAFAQIFENRAVRAIILTGTGREFIAGIDISEILKIKDKDNCLAKLMNIHRLLNTIEQGPKPVLAMINGHCSRGGLEIALACHYRVVAGGVRLGMLDLRFGLIPGMGGTQRLPRVVGVKTALSMITAAQDIPAEQALSSGLADEIAEAEKLREKSIIAARQFISGRINFRMRLTGKRFDKLLSSAEKKEITALFRDRLSHTSAGQTAPFRAVEAVERGLGINFLSDIRTEAALFCECATSDISKNLIRVFINTRDAGTLIRIRGEKHRKIRKIGIVGSNIAATGIAGILLQRGFEIHVMGVNPASLERGMTQIRNTLYQSLQKEQIIEKKLEQWIAGRLHGTTQLKELADADMIIESVKEDMELRQKIFRNLEKICRPDTVFASASSVLPVSRIASVLEDPSRIIGLHFLNPPGKIRLLEISCARITADDILATAVEFARKLRKIPVVVNDSPGFFASRQLFTLINEACFLAAEGVNPFSIDKVMAEFGLPMGPFRLSDLTGTDAVFMAERQLSEAFGEKWPICPLWERLEKTGGMGRKNGIGWYDYRTESTALNPAFQEVIKGYMAENHILPKNISQESILEQLMLRLINEGARAVSDGVSKDAGQLDIAMIYGLGFPAHRGGIFSYADALGIPRVVEILSGLESEKGPRFRPSELLRKMADKGRNFYE